MVKEGHQTRKALDTTTVLINANTTTETPTYTRTGCWYFGWFILCLITITAQTIMTIYVISDLIYIFKHVKSWPLYDHGNTARGIIAIGNESYGIIAIGQSAHGVIAIGQMAFGLFTIGQVGLGLLFTLCQVGGGLFYAIGQGVAATKVLYAQIAFSAWKTHKAQLGFNIGSSICSGNKLVTYCVCCKNCTKYKRYDINTNNKNVKCGVNGIMNSVRYPKFWPKKAREEFTQYLHNHPIEKVLENMVYESAKGKYHCLDKLNEYELKETVDHLLELKEEFAEIAMKNFPLTTTI